MAAMILIDAGPLIALIHADDRHHDRCRAVLASLREPLATAWPAVAEAMYIDRRDFQVYRPRGLGRFTILP